jgi:hypothetical protein
MLAHAVTPLLAARTLTRARCACSTVPLLAAGLPSSASHQSSTLRASLDEELDPGSSRGRPIASPPVEISGIGRHRSAGAGTATAAAAAVAAGNVRPRGTYTRLVRRPAAPCFAAGCCWLLFSGMHNALAHSQQQHV